MSRAVSQQRVLSSAREQFVLSMPGHFERLGWGNDRLIRFQTERLRSLLAAAIERSPFHARRLTGVDPARFELADLPSLPPMTKAEMMGAYDEVVTDHRITMTSVDTHLERLAEQPSLYLDEYVTMSSGGSSGVRGVYACHHTAAVEFTSAVLRPGLARMAAVTGWPPPFPAPLAIVAAPVCVHATRVLPTLVQGTVAEITFAPVTLPFDEIVERVSRAQPMVLVGYATAIARLADVRAAGRLPINPQLVVVASEQLTPELVDRITRGFGVPPTNSFASSEGLIGSAPPGSDVFDFASDLAILEFVDDQDEPVTAGTEAHHVLVTNLFNHAQPLIRFRLDDTMTEQPVSPEGHGHQRARLEGRNDEHLDLGGALVHPLAIRSVLVREPRIVEHQIRSDAGGVVVDVITTGDVDLHDLERRAASALAVAGASSAAVTLRRVDRLDRDPRTGKVRRTAAVTPT